MRLSVNKDQFLKALNIASRAVAGKNPDPVLANLKLELTEKGLEVTGTNSEIAIRSTVPYMVDGQTVIRGPGLGSTLVNAHLLTEIVRRMAGAEVSFEVIDESIAKLDDGRSSFKLNCTKAEEYPDIDFEPSGVSFGVACAELAALIEQSAFAASSKDSRPVLTAVNLEAGDGMLIATATDSARLARKTIHIESSAKFRVNIPARVVSDVTKLFEGAESVEVAVSESRALFSFDNTVVASRLISGDYPVSKSIIPQNFNYRLEVNGQELLAAMGRISILSAEREGVVTLSMSENEVEVSARSELTGSANESIENFSFNGEYLEVSFNSLFVIDAIRALKCEDVVLSFQNEKRPLLVITNPKDDSAIELITPMRSR